MVGRVGHGGSFPRKLTSDKLASVQVGVNERASTVARSRNRKGQGHQLREEILTAGLEVLAATSDARQVTIRAVAVAAGVSPPAIYLYFPDRAALLRALVDRGFGLFDTHLTRATENVEEPAGRLRRLCLAYLDFAHTHPGVYRVVFSAAGLGPAELGVADGEEHPGRASLTALVAAVAACGHPGDDPFGKAVQLWCMLHGLADLKLTKPELDWPPIDRLIDQTLTDLQLTGTPPTVHSPRRAE
ncbi:MAG: TetR family transcriptional regulator [Streptosporangiales bacterium]|nr:TetR family transcriptional regulator [Streptosporangiales bacterium]